MAPREPLDVKLTASATDLPRRHAAVFVPHGSWNVRLVTGGWCFNGRDWSSTCFVWYPNIAGHPIKRDGKPQPLSAFSSAAQLGTGRRGTEREVFEDFNRFTWTLDIASFDHTEPFFGHPVLFFINDVGELDNAGGLHLRLEPV